MNVEAFKASVADSIRLAAVEHAQDHARQSRLILIAFAVGVIYGALACTVIWGAAAHWMGWLT